MTFQKIFDKAKSIIKEEACMNFYDETKLPYTETDASAVRLGAALLLTRSGTHCPRDEVPDNSILRPITFMSNSLARVEKDAAT